MADGYISQIKLPNEETYDFRDRNLKVYTGSCSTAAGTAIKDVITDGIFTLEKGAVLFVNFTNTNSAAVGNLKLKINGEADTSAKPIKYLVNGNDPANIPGAGYLRANQTYMFRYDGTNWVADLNYYTYSNDFANKIGHYNNILARKAITAESLIVGDETGYEKVASGVTFNLAYPIVWCTDTVNANASNYANMFLQHYDRNIATGAKTGFTSAANKVIYLIVTINGNIATIDSNIITDTLPSSDDGKVYISLGKLGAQSTGANYFFLYPVHPMFWYKNGAIREYSGASQYALAAPLSGISGADDLKAIEAISGTTGLLKKTAANTWTLDTSNYVTSSGITSVTIGATSPVQSSTSTAQNGSSASTTISLKDAYGDTKNPYGAKAKNLVLAGPSSGSNAAPTFRALVAADIPSLAYVPATSGANDVNTLVNTGIYNITSGSLTNGPVGYGYGQLLVMSYRKHTGNTTTDWATQLYAHLGSGNNGNTLYFRTSNASTWQTWQMVAHANAGTGKGGTTIPIYINAKGEIQEGTALKDLAYISKGTGSTKFLREDGTWQTALTSHQSLVAYAPLASPALTGTPTAPTAANGTNTTQIATTAFVNNTLSYVNAMRFKGTLGTGGTITALPASHEAGDTYRVITAGTWAGKYCEVGTLIICVKDGTAAADADWTSVETNEDGAVIGPTSSTDNAIARFDGTTGRIIQNSGITIDDNGNLLISHAASATMTADSTNPKITFAESGTQPVHLIYSDYDSYRSPAGLKIIGGTSASPVWLEVEGNIYAAAFKGHADSATSANYINLYEARGTTTTLNKVANYIGAGKMFHLVASSSTSATDNGKTPTDANILQMNWDNSGGYDAQLGIATGANRMYFRSRPSQKIAWDEVAHAPVGATGVGNATQPVYMTSEGVITAGTALKALAYKDSLISSDIPDNAANTTGNAATATAIQTAGTTAQFYRGDNTWSNILKQTAASALGIDTNRKIGTAIKDLHFTVGSGSGTGINDGNAGGITIGTDTASYGGIYWQSSGSYGLRLHFATTGSFANGAYTRMLITHDGKVGIGTLTPDTLLTVNGNAKADKFIGALQGNADTATNATNHIARTDNPHNVTAAQLGLGNVENTKLSTWTGSTNITTLGTITTGTWNGTAIANNKLVNSSLTVGNKSINLGASGTVDEIITYSTTIGQNTSWDITNSGAYPAYYSSGFSGDQNPSTNQNAPYSYGTLYVMRANTAGAAQFYISHHASSSKNAANGIRYRSGWDVTNTEKTVAQRWEAWATILDDKNYNLYSPKLDGTGATGSWGINITGNAANVTGTVAIGHGGTGATSAADARTNLGLGTIATKADTAYIKFGGDDTGLGNSSPAATAKTYWADATKVSDNMITGYYNRSGTEYSLLFSKRSTYGSILKWGYGDRYLRILRVQSGTWKSTDWEKIDAGYADSAGTATSAGKWTTTRTLTIGSTGKSVDGSGNVSWSLAEIGAAASSHTHPVSQLTWGGGVNLATTATANNQEWSIDLSPGTYTGTYWHVWSTPKNGSILTCHPDDRHVTMPGNIASTSTSTGTLQVTGGIGATGQVTATRLAANGSDTTYNLYVNGPSYSNINAYMPYQLSLDNPKVSRKLTEHNTSSYRHWIVLLLPYQTATNTSINNYIHGHIHFKKTGSNIYDEVFISANLCYNQLKYRLENYGDGGSTAFTPISCTYNGVKYFALKCYDHDNPWTEIYFDGYCISSYPGGNNTSTKPLTLPYMINYKGNGTQAGAQTIVNTEVNNSISTTLTDSIVTNVSRYYPYMNINGNASTASKTTAANLTTTANAIAYYTDTTGTLGTKASANGALYATSANGALSWGTLPIAQGGTGKTSAADAWAALGGGASGKHDDSYFAKASHNHAASDINSGTFDATRIPNLSWNKITSDKPTTLSGYGITDAKIASGVITLGSNTITPVTSVNGHSGSSVSVTASDLGLASALKYVGTKSSLPTATDSATYSTYNNGDVITVSAKEYAYVKGSNAAGSSWVELGDEGSYKLRQTAFANSTGTADGTNTSTSFIYSFSQNENGAISDIKTRQLPTLTNVSFTAATDNNDYPVLMKNSTGSDTTAAGVKFANTSGKMTTINPNTGIITAPGGISAGHLTLTSTSAESHLTFSRAGWNYITMPNNDSSVISIGYGTPADNTTQRLVIYKTGTVRPGTNGSQNLGDDTHKWNNVYGVSFYGSTFSGTANKANYLRCFGLESNDDLNLIDSHADEGIFQNCWVGGGQASSIQNRPDSYGVASFGMLAFKIATNWTGQILLSTNSAPGLYWRANNNSSSPAYGAWARVWDSSNHRVFYGTCTEAAGTAAKTVGCANYDEMKVGDIITVKFNNTNTAASPTLNVNGKGSKSVKMAYSGGTADLSSYTQLAGIRTFIYDGTNWILQEGECVKQGVTDTTSDIWRPVMLGAYNSTDVRQAPEQRYAMIHAARNVKYHQTTGTLRAPILKTPKLSIEYSFEDKAHIQWNDTDSSIDFIFD